MHFSPREQQIIERLIAGDSQKEIARHLGLSRNTIAGIIASARARAAARSTEQLVAMAVQSYPTKYYPNI